MVLSWAAATPNGAGWRVWLANGYDRLPQSGRPREQGRPGRGRPTAVGSATRRVRGDARIRCSRLGAAAAAVVRRRAWSGVDAAVLAAAGRLVWGSQGEGERSSFWALALVRCAQLGSGGSAQAVAALGARPSPPARSTRLEAALGCSQGCWGVPQRCGRERPSPGEADLGAESEPSAACEGRRRCAHVAAAAPDDSGAGRQSRRQGRRQRPTCGAAAGP